MDHLIASVQSLSASETDWPQLHQQLKQLDKNVQPQPQQIAQALKTLDPAVHSLAVLYLLDAQAKAVGNQGDQQFVKSVCTFLQVCHPQQIRLAPEPFCSLCRKLREQAVALHDPRAAVLALRSAVRKLQPTSEHLTPIHAEFFNICLKSKHYNAAAELLEEDILFVEPGKTAVTHTDFLLYCYYGGMLCIGRRSYSRALDLFLLALTAPTMVGNAIAVATYKKFILVSLLKDGLSPTLPKFTSNKLKQVVESESKPYYDLASAYTAHNLQQLQANCEQHQNVFSQDGNTGLVKLVVKSFNKRNIQRLTSVYLTLSLEDIAKIVGLANATDAEVYILRLIEAGEVHAHISSKDGMVKFLEEPEQYDNAAMAARIASCVEASMQLAGKMQQVHNTVTCDKLYLQRMTSKDKSRMDHGGEEFGLGAVLYPQP